MPKHIEDYRVIHEPLRLALTTRDEHGDDGWPKYKHLFAFLREQRDWSGSEREYRLLRLHGTGPAPLVEGLIFYMLKFWPHHFKDFVREHDDVAPDTLTLDDVLERFTSLANAEQANTDWRQRDTWMGMTSLFASICFGDEERMAISSSRQLEQFSQWILRDIGNAIALAQLTGRPPTESRKERSKAELIAIGEEWTGRSADELYRQLQSWWRASEWSIVQAVLGETPVGVSVILPLREEVYASVKRGELSDLDISEEHLTHPSRHLMIEAMSSSWECTPKTRVGWATGRQLCSAIYHAARLTWSADSEFPKGTPIHTLAVGGTPSNAARLERHGYSRVGTLCGFQVPLYELVLPDPVGTPWLPRSPRQSQSAMLAACYHHFQRQR